MPISAFQQRVLVLLARNRNPQAYVAGGVAIHRFPNSKRYSKDVDLFHDVAESVALSSQHDLELLRRCAYTTELLLNQPSFVRALVSKHDASVVLEWVHDTAFRFFPTQEDEYLGFRLHDVDLAVNKCLALANRNEVRDIVDLIELQHHVMPLSGMLWAASGKDPGFTPPLLLQCVRRHSVIRPEQLRGEALVEPISPSGLKKEWLALLEAAEEELSQLPAEDLGCVYVDEQGEALRKALYPLPKDAVRHFGTVGGSWPKATEPPSQ